jgi:hypothetical protein
MWDYHAILCFPEEGEDIIRQLDNVGYGVVYNFVDRESGLRHLLLARWVDRGARKRKKKAR